MQLHQLRYFVAVAEKGSFSKAAMKLDVAQSAVSLQVRRLEESLGVSLFERTTQGTSLTAAGRRLLGYATTILDQVALAEEMVPRQRTGSKISVRLGVPSGIAQLLSVPLLKDIGETLPGIDLKIVEALSGDLQDQLADGRLEMALLFKPKEGFGSAGEASESIYLVEAFRRDTPTGAPLRLRDLADVELTMPTLRHQIRRFLTEEAARQHIKLRIRAELDGQARILQLVIAGKARTVMLASSFLRDWHARRVTVRLIEDFSVVPVIVLAANRKVKGGRAVEAVRRRVELLVREISEASTKLSDKYLLD